MSDKRGRWRSAVSLHPRSDGFEFRQSYTEVFDKSPGEGGQGATAPVHNAYRGELKRQLGPGERRERPCLSAGRTERLIPTIAASQANTVCPTVLTGDCFRRRQFAEAIAACRACEQVAVQICERHRRHPGQRMARADMEARRNLLQRHDVEPVNPACLPRVGDASPCFPRLAALGKTQEYLRNL